MAHYEKKNSQEFFSRNLLIKSFQASISFWGKHLDTLTNVGNTNAGSDKPRNRQTSESTNLGIDKPRTRQTSESENLGIDKLPSPP